MAIDPETTSRAWREILSLAPAEALTVHDAAYLELAIRAGLALLARNGQLAAAAKRNGIIVLP
jgi:predicted nucleic acid-binding protein